MRNLLALIGALVVTVTGLGWYLDWFKIRNSPAPAGHRSLNIDINTVKISEDFHRGSAKVQEVLEKNKDNAEAKAKAAADGKAKSADPGKPGAGKVDQPDPKKPFIEEGEEAEESPFDFGAPRPGSEATSGRPPRQSPDR
jgi:hypothetical protein